MYFVVVCHFFIYVSGGAVENIPDLLAANGEYDSIESFEETIRQWQNDANYDVEFQRKHTDSYDCCTATCGASEDCSFYLHLSRRKHSDIR